MSLIVVGLVWCLSMRLLLLRVWRDSQFIECSFEVWRELHVQ